MDKQDELYQMEIDHLTDVAIKSHMLIGKISEIAKRVNNNEILSLIQKYNETA